MDLTDLQLKQLFVSNGNKWQDDDRFATGLQNPIQKQDLGDQSLAGTCRR